MAAAKYDFNIEQGSSFKFSIVYKDENGNPIDLTNWCSRLIWKTNTNIIQTFSTENINYSEYKFIIEPQIGKLSLLLPASTTNSLNFNSAKYDIELQSEDDLYNGGGKYIIRLLSGTINIIKRFSQSPDLLECQP